MTQRIVFADIKAYLTAVVKKAVGDINDSPHGRFWDIPYQQFITGTVPNQKCNGADIPLINTQDPRNSAFLLILKDANGFCGKEQMPAGGPFLSSATSFSMQDGTKLSGQQILSNIESWLLNGYPEV